MIELIILLHKPLYTFSKWLIFLIIKITGNLMVNKNAPVENKMGTMPVLKLIFNMSLPIMFSMLVMALYNIVDSIFVGKICDEALAAVSLAFPIQNLMVSFAVGTSVGVNALLSLKLGQQNQNDVNKTAICIFKISDRK